MKLFLCILVCVVAILAALLLFPNAASQPVRIEILGWLFETRSGIFALLLCMVWLTYWGLNKLFLASIHGPQKIWSNLRSGNSKRRESRLQEAIAVWVDEGDGHSQKQLKRSKGVIPPWLHDTLTLWMAKPGAHTIHETNDSPLNIALKARLATDAEHIGNLSLSERQYYLDAWLAAHPAAPLALQRKARLLGDLNSPLEQVALFESLWDKQKNVSSLKPDYACALRLAAKQQPEQALSHLRKAHRLDRDNAEVTIDLACALSDAGDSKSAERILLDYLSTHDVLYVAQAALDLFSSQPLQYFKQVDKPIYIKSIAGSWLRACLAHQADLFGLAEDGLQSLLDDHPRPLFWQTRAAWHSEKGEWEKAVACYQKMICHSAIMPK